MSIKINNLLGKIILKKKGIFIDDTIILFITPSFKIVKIEKINNIKFLYKEKDSIKFEGFSKWIVKNNYKFFFNTKNSKLKRDLLFYFDDIILTNNKRGWFFSSSVNFFVSFIRRIFILK